MPLHHSVKRSRTYSCWLLLLAVLASACSGSSSRSPDSDSFRRIIERGELRAAYIPYPPSLDLNPDTGQFSGIFYEVLAELTHNLGLELSMTEEVAWGSMIEAVKSERVDLVCSGIWPNSSRAREADFSVPIYFSPIYAYIRPDEHRFDNHLELVNNEAIKIATIDGEMSSIIASEDFPRAKVVTLPQLADVSQLLLEVQTGKADITFVEAAVAASYLSQNPASVARVKSELPVRVFPNAFLLPKSAYALKAALSTAIGELHNTGFIDRTLNRYDANGELFLRVSLPYRPMQAQGLGGSSE